ncbi:hypothetical protein ACFL6R_06540 [Gemmatimonadota bacterium]
MNRSDPARRLLLSASLILLITAVNCNPAPSEPDEQQFTDLTGDWFSQPLPGLTPVRFSLPPFRATSEWFWHGAPFFSPDGDEMYYVRYNVDGPVQIQFTEQVDGRWTMPRTPSFAMEDSENNPVISPDGQRIYFVSMRAGKQILTAERSGTGWTEPEPLNIPNPAGLEIGWQFSLADDGTLYFELWDGGDPSQLDLYCSELVDGSYTTPVSLGPGINSDSNDFCPFIDPEEEFLIFVSQRPEGFGLSDLYIAFRNPDETWGEPVHPGAPFNTSNPDVWPYIPYDGNVLFFVSGRAGDEGFNPYWVDAAIIETWRPGG